ncbi:MAG: bifunctional glutamate N-acetyltransferase/amino-acid acetyltransferase ArgJ [Chloroflexi bacterium]|nr:bifunctional glutamate N-acetyltransferase/amino-acid acetyltransferase ArgJ [Chloroflexota bacterium]
MTAIIEVIPNGSVTSPRGFKAGATYAGLKTYGADKLDLALLLSETLCSAAGVFSTNKIVSPSVTLSKKRISAGAIKAIVANSGCANTCVGDQGLKDAEEMTFLAARHLGIKDEETLVCSTGIIGVELPLALIRQSISKIQLSPDGGHTMARAIMTTDSHPKEMAISLKINNRTVNLGGIAKGSGMIHPNLATMLCFLTTDAAIEKSFLQDALNRATEVSFNMIDVDGDQSTNDSVILLSNGAAGGDTIRAGSPAADIFQQGLTYLCIGLAKELARDGEGATKLIEATVEGARNTEQAGAAARSIVSSLLVKAAVHGNDPNWGRIMMAVGKSGVELEESKIALYVNEICLVEEGRPIPYFQDAVVAAIKSGDVSFRVKLNVGDGSATAWGCDLTTEYVTFNAAYTT